MSVVLAFITRNSVEKLSSTPITLRDVLDSTLQIPYRNMILVDDSDSGKTFKVFREWCGEHGKVLTHTRSEGFGYGRPTRAVARQIAIDLFLQDFDEEWLMFVDDDVVLRPGWWKWVVESRVLEDPKVGEVWGINWDADPTRERLLKLVGADLGQYLIRKFGERGGTHDTMYRREALKGVRIPPALHVYEDAYLHHWVRCRGWRSVVNPVGVLHYHPLYATDLRGELEKMRFAIEVAARYGIVEYENAKTYLSLLRPVAGIVPMMLTTIKTYGLRRGFVEAVKRQYLKLWFRWQVLRNVKGEIPDVCEAIGGRR